MERILVTESFLPPLAEYNKYLERIWQNNYLTNQGPLLKEFEEKLKQYLDVEQLHFVTNGTVALQIALRSLDITEGEVITTPFSFVATTSAILWERCTPVFVDIEPSSLNIDPKKIEAAITPKTKAIMAVHVFGNPCDVEFIERIAAKHKLKVIYDGAHAFGVSYGGKALLAYGDVSTCSFHATKVFHSIEGGLVVTPHKDVSDKLELIKKFGYVGDEQKMLGINAKASEFQAAMGLCNLNYFDELISQRERAYDLYNKLLPSTLERPTLRPGTEYNYIYYPVLLEDEEQLQRVMAALAKDNIFARRYFYPSLNQLPYLEKTSKCPISEDVASRILCLPLYSGLSDQNVERICRIIANTNGI